MKIKSTESHRMTKSKEERAFKVLNDLSQERITLKEINKLRQSEAQENRTIQKNQFL